MQMKVHLSIDNVGLPKKPPGKEIAAAKKRASERWQEIEISEAADLIGNRGHAVVPGHMMGGLKAENCIAMQVFMLDFDDGVSFREIKCRCEEIGIPISFAYHTYSSKKEKERFRVVFVHEFLIEDMFIVKVAINMLYSIFPKCDHACSNPDRAFLGGTGVIYCNESAHFALVQLLLPFLDALDKNKNFSRNIQDFCRKNKILQYNGRPAMGNDSFYHEFSKKDGNKDSVIIHNIEKTGFPSFYIVEGVRGHKSIRCRQDKKRLVIGESECQLLNDFISGIEIDHNGRFAILTNLMQINGGVKKFFQIMEEFYEADSIEKWKKDAYHMKGYSPMRCSGSFCPYYEKCENAGNIVETLAMDRKIFREDIEYCSLEEAAECMENNLSRAYHARGIGIHLIKAQTGIGKTRAYIRLIKGTPNGKFIIAVPTIRLKEEIYARLLADGVMPNEIFKTVNIWGNSLIPVEIQKAVSAAHDIGEHELPRKIVRDYYHEIKNDANMRFIAEECRRYLAGVQEVTGERVIVTTHAYLMNIAESFLQQYTVIIDEDILQLHLMKQTARVSMNSLRILARENLGPYSEIAERMLQAEEGDYQRMPDGERAAPLTTEQLEELGCHDGSNVNDMMYAGSFVKIRNEQSGEPEVVYFCPGHLPKAKYVVFSATLNEMIYRRYFEKRMPVYSYPCKKARYKGRLIQYTYHSLGRRDLSKKQQVFPFAKKTAGNKKVEMITFMKMAGQKELEENVFSGIHFGNSTGINTLEGKDLVIVGTPYNIQESYKLVACYLGTDVNQSVDRQPKIRRVDYNHTSFLITTYKDPLLREIQLSSIESELEQCIGRTRLLRHDCSVYVFSCFPCEQAELFIRNYLIDYEMEE